MRRHKKNETDTGQNVEAEIMTVPMLARYLRCHSSTIYRLLKHRQIPAFRLGSDWRFNKSSIEQWIKNGSIKLK